MDPATGLCFPWYTHPFLNDLKDWYLADKTVLEFGGGLSTMWWRRKAKWVDTIETDPEWTDHIVEQCWQAQYTNGIVHCTKLADGLASDMPKYFDLIPKRPNGHYDIIIVDGIYRTEALQWAIDHLKGHRGIIIADNWQQDFVWISPKAEEIMKPYQIQQFYQPGHADHEGRPWNTSFWIIDDRPDRP